MRRWYNKARFVCPDCRAVKVINVKPTGVVPIQQCDRCGRQLFIFEALKE